MEDVALSEVSVARLYSAPGTNSASLEGNIYHVVNGNICITLLKRFTCEIELGVGRGICVCCRKPATVSVI
jgi:hypothetical protein